MSERAPSVGLTRALTVLHSDIYRIAHAWNPPASNLTDVAQELLLDQDELIPDALIMAMDGTEPIAVAGLTEE